MMVVWFTNASPQSRSVRIPFPNTQQTLTPSKFWGRMSYRDKCKKHQQDQVSQNLTYSKSVEDYLWIWTSDELDISQQIH